MTICPDYIPQNYDRIKIVESREELFATPFDENTDVILYPRSILSKEFNELAAAGAFKTVAKLAKTFMNDEPSERHLKDHWLTLSQFKKFKNLIVASAHQQTVGRALDLIEQDIEASSQAKFSSILMEKSFLRLITQTGYGNDTDKYHTDALDHYGRLMCIYTPFTTKYLRNQDASIGDLSDDGRTYLYNRTSNACSFSFGIGDMSRHSENFIHRARPSDSPDIPSMRLVI